MRLAGKTVIVTGAAHGIGRAYAERIGADGANVALVDLDVERAREVAAGIESATTNACRASASAAANRSRTAAVRCTMRIVLVDMARSL